jgi:hypothetical protein
MKKSRDSGKSSETRNMSSGKNQEGVRPWTDEEMSKIVEGEPFNARFGSKADFAPASAFGGYC